MNKPTIQIIKSTIKEHVFLSLGIVIVTIMVVVLSLIPPQILRLIIDNNLTPKVLAGLLPLVIAYLVVVILIGLFDFFKGALLIIFGQKIIYHFRTQMNQKIQKIAYQYFSANTTGEVSARFLNDVDNVSSLFSDGLISMFIDALKIIGILVSIAMFSLQLMLLVIVFIIIIYVITKLFQKRMLKAQNNNLTQLSQVNEHISETLKNIKMIKSFSKESYMENSYLNKLDDNYRTIGKVNFYDSIYAPIIKIIRAVAITLIVLLAAKPLGVLSISVGMIAASIDLISNLFAPIEALGMEFQSIQKGLSGLARIDSFLKLPESETKNEDYTKDRLFSNANEQALIFDHVYFSYEDGRKEVLKDLSFKIAKGDNFCLTGRTGVGKTTLFKLIMGLEKPTKGHISWGSYDVYQIPNQAKRYIFGYVEQSFSFIEGTIAQQISLNDPSISNEDVINSLKFVDLYDEIISNFPLGIDTDLSIDNSFSQGQCQLLAIARAIVCNPPILLLDEITANLDSVSEKKIIQILTDAKSNRTVLSISHRLSAMLNCDQTIVIENGMIANKS